METTLQVLNGMERAGVIRRYAIGGAVGAIFYMEPFLTYDLDVFVFLPQTKSGLTTVSPIYQYLRRKGYQTQREQIVIEGIPVQFIPAYNELVEEALKGARELFYKRTRTRVLRAEHLLAIMLQTYRPKDRARMTQLLEEARIDLRYLRRIIARHGLQGKWQEFKRRFYGA